MDLHSYLFCLSFYLLYFFLPPFKDNGLLFWVPDVLCRHSEVVLWNLLSIQMFFWWICGRESGLPILFLHGLRTAFSTVPRIYFLIVLKASFLIVLIVLKPELRMPVVLVSEKDSFSVLQMATFSLYSHNQRVLISFPSYKATKLIIMVQTSWPLLP